MFPPAGGSRHTAVHASLCGSVLCIHEQRGRRKFQGELFGTSCNAASLSALRMPILTQEFATCCCTSCMPAKACLLVDCLRLGRQYAGIAGPQREMLKRLLDNNCNRDGGLAAIPGNKPSLERLPVPCASQGMDLRKLMHQSRTLAMVSTNFYMSPSLEIPINCFTALLAADHQLCTSPPAAPIGSHEWRHNSRQCIPLLVRVLVPGAVPGAV